MCCPAICPQQSIGSYYYQRETVLPCAHQNSYLPREDLCIQLTVPALQTSSTVSWPQCSVGWCFSDQVAHKEPFNELFKKEKLLA